MTSPDHTIHSVTDLTSGSPTVSGEQLYLDWRPDIERNLAAVARRHALSGSDADDFAAWATSRLIENDAAILRKFGGRSSVSTYLAVVISNLLHDFRNSIWGRWRPSAAAMRLGPIGVRLEELIIRDACPVRDAIGILRSSGAVESDAQLSQWAARLSRRINDRDVPIENAAEHLTDERADSVAVTEERDRVLLALRQAIEHMPAEDRLITKMRFWDNYPIADIATALHLAPKPLYRRIEGIARRLHGTLTRHGIAKSDVLELLAEDRLW
ncbi:MAG: sigma-70 family RNA polymerase sigma factor [Gemmatimonadaceae bacterium]|nr:sigma-70 family RNA polymerase sigma factor [Gemmatimonadaceae bacterium]